MKSTKPRMAISKQEIIKLLSIVGVMDMEEISRMFPDAGGTIKTVVDHLFKDRRLTKVGGQIALDTGTVKDADGETIIGANVLWEGTHSGTTTDSQGWFSIRKPNTTPARTIPECSASSLTASNMRFSMPPPDRRTL